MTRIGRSSAGHLAVGRMSAAMVDIDEFAEICGEESDPSDHAFASALQEGVPVYIAADVHSAIGAASTRIELLDEWANCLANGPGVFVVSGAFKVGAVDSMTTVFNRIIAAEVAAGASVADHFAEEGANTRAWNVLQKCAASDPEVFAAYYSNEVIATAAESWLGPWYQLSAQVNIVHPGGAAQRPHRDYHLGFQTEADVARFPRHSHLLSQTLTLQGAVAHSEMPISSGPTRFLPFSQRYPAGYLAWRDSRFVDFFERNSVQLSLDKGDAVFFNPGLHHGAGHNVTIDTERIANLLQISSAMGRPLEAIDTYAIARNIFPAMQRMAKSGELSDEEARCLIAASADGYSFPSNLDTDPPTEGMAPQTAQQLMQVAFSERWEPDVFTRALVSHQNKRTP